MKLRSNDCFFWFETSKIDKNNFHSFYFNNPKDVLILTNPQNTQKYFNNLEKLAQQYYVAGFFSYELGYLFEEKFNYKKEPDFPLALFCVYEKPAVYDHRKKTFIKGTFSLPENHLDYKVENLRLNIEKNKYLNDLVKIQEYISSGDVYQVNYTMKYKFDFSGSPVGLYFDLKKKQDASYNVLAGFDDYHILSLSPELYFRKIGKEITVKPMKGTFRRGVNKAEDDKNVNFLSSDMKNKSENLMIVDLLRNDLGKISEYDSVKVLKMFEIEKYNTLFQMTSTIESRLKENISLYETIKGIFPSGSVTGAPKIRSMEIIDELEQESRKVYTGAIGFLGPGGEAKFNVAIRTVLLHKGKGEMGIGGGIVHDSTSEEEFEECRIKAEFLVKPAVSEFKLIETILYDHRYEYLEFHLNRLKESALYFGFRFNYNEILEELECIKPALNDEKYKVRLLLDKSGKIVLSYEEIKIPENKLKITLSCKKTDTGNIFYFHKTTERDLYEKELCEARKNGFFDLLFFNKNEEVTEGAITNVFIEKNGCIYTPPLKCGLLDGVMRRVVVEKHHIKETVIKLNDLKNAEGIYVSNSIIGFRQVELVFLD